VADAERLDVEDTAAEQRRYAVQHTGLIFDENNEGMLHMSSAVIYEFTNLRIVGFNLTIPIRQFVNPSYC